MEEIITNKHRRSVLIENIKKETTELREYIIKEGGVPSTEEERDKLLEEIRKEYKDKPIITNKQLIEKINEVL